MENERKQQEIKRAAAKKLAKKKAEEKVKSAAKAKAKGSPDLFAFAGEPDSKFVEPRELSGVEARFMEAAGLLLMFVSVFLCVSFLTYNAADPSMNHATSNELVRNSAGLLGAFTSDFLLQTIGGAAFLIPLTFIIWSFRLFFHKPVYEVSTKLITLFAMLVSFAALLHTMELIPNWPTEQGVGNGGLVGVVIGVTLARWAGEFSAFFLPFLTTLICALFLLQLTMNDIFFYTKKLNVLALQLMSTLKNRVQRVKPTGQMEMGLPVPEAKKPKLTLKPKLKKLAAQVEIPKHEEKESKRVQDEKQGSLFGSSESGDGAYQLPPLHLLNDKTGEAKQLSETALQQNARQIEAQLSNFGVEGKVTRICPGPVITIYELEPAAGVKSSKVIGLSDDLARAMSAVSIRIATIPGRNVLGIEMPNADRETVNFKDLLSTEAFETHPGKLAISMGVDTSGKPVYADISKMPHALIAGTTGSGKSVAMNGIIVSLLYRLNPDQLKFIMIDPKMLELSIYNDIPHLLTPVVTDPSKANVVLKWAVKEMENRYRMMADLGVKNIQNFNAKFNELKEQGKVPTKLVQVGFEPETGKPKMEEKPLATEPLPYLVVIIDELADLMMVAGKEVEISIARLAQMARAAGIHLLVATQRPSVDVVTGLIKANIPTRCSFNVTSRIDSRTVLDSMGAESLLGRGDMLFMENGAPNLARLHGAFVDEDECIRVAEYCKEQTKPTYIQSFDTSEESGGEAGAGMTGVENTGDELYNRAIEIVSREQKASTSFIQRHLKIGYNRAATIIDQMETDGLIGPANHVGKREVIMRKPPEEGY